MDHQHHPFENMIFGEETCKSCGLVLREKLFDYGDHGKKSNRFDGDHLDNADPAVGVDVARHDWGLGSTFRVPKRSHDEEHRQLWMRLLHLQNQASVGSWRERSIRDALVGLDKICERVGVPKSIQREVAYWFRRLKSADRTAGRSRWLTIAALVHIICERNGFPRTEAEIWNSVESEGIHYTKKTLRKTVSGLRSWLTAQLRTGGEKR